MVDKPADSLFHVLLFRQFFQFLEHVVYFSIEVCSQFFVEQFHTARLCVADAADDVITQVDNLQEYFAGSIKYFSHREHRAHPGPIYTGTSAHFPGRRHVA